MESPLRIQPEPGLTLIETLLWDGTRFPRLALHRARLEKSAAILGWDARGFTAALSDMPPHPARVRATLDAAGTVAVTHAPLPPPALHWTVQIAPSRLQSADPWLQHKTTRRGLYDQTRANLPPGLDEVIFLNERDEVCEGTITTVFFQRGTNLCTPPLSCGVLPGVLRAELLAAGKVAEAILPAADLPKTPLWLGNALRGLIPARLIL